MARKLHPDSHCSAWPEAMIRKLLIANRGEVAVRIMRACRQLGIQTVAVCSEADARASYLRLADQMVCIGPSQTSHSYGNGVAVLLAAEATEVDAIHPGYGFLAENAEFAADVEAAGLIFVGPPASVIAMMADKIVAKRVMRDAGLPCVPGSDGPLPACPALVKEIAGQTGYTLIIKAAAGGGGRGMRIARCEADLAGAVEVARQEALRFFNSPVVYAERFLAEPRHVEVQVLCDRHGTILSLGTRDCSLQRRHQKVLEEAPAAGLDPDRVAAVTEGCRTACQAIGYVGAGTFEFLVQDGKFYFIEMNTRLQVEHPVTEAVTGIDIVKAQILVASGERLRWTQEDITVSGHAIECRINAEDATTFVPSPGRVTRWDIPGGPGVRFDTHLVAGDDVSRHYDSLVAKLIVHADKRPEAIVAMGAALDELIVEGISTNKGLHLRLLADPKFRTGSPTIHHLGALLAAATATAGSGD